MVKKGYVQCQPCLRLRDVPLRRGSNPGLLDQWTKATGVPLQNKPCKDGWVEEGRGPHMHHNQKNKPYTPSIKNVFQNAKKDHFYLLSQTRETPQSSG